MAAKAICTVSHHFDRPDRTMAGKGYLPMRPTQWKKQKQRKKNALPRVQQYSNHRFRGTDPVEIAKAYSCSTLKKQLHWDYMTLTCPRVGPKSMLRTWEESSKHGQMLVRIHTARHGRVEFTWGPHEALKLAENPNGFDL